MNKRIITAMIISVMIFNAAALALTGYKIINLSEEINEIPSALGNGLIATGHFASKINDPGQVVIESSYQILPQPDPFPQLKVPIQKISVWDNGQLTDMGQLTIKGRLRLRGGNVSGFNNSGQVLTFSGLIEDGQFNNLGIGTVMGGGLYAINDFGQIIGVETNILLPIHPAGPSSVERNAFLYDPTDGFTEIGPFFERRITPIDINNNGQILINDKMLYIWNMNTGDITEISTDRLSAVDINNNGQVTGSMPSDIPLPYKIILARDSFFWDEESGITRISPINDDETIYSSAINDEGQIVGNCGIFEVLTWPYDNNRQSKAFIWDKDTGVVYLDDFLEEDSEWDRLTVANDINNDGWVVGEGVTKDGQVHAFLMIPMTEPADIIAYHLEDAINNKLKALENISEAISGEQQATEVLNEMLETGEFGEFKRSDIAKTMTQIQQSRMREEKIQTEIEKTISDLENALSQLQE